MENISLFAIFSKFESLNHKAILEKICQLDPGVVHDVVTELGSFASGLVDPKYAEVVRLVNAGSIVASIKEMRMISGLGLKESKDAVELFQGKVFGSEYPPNEASRNAYKSLLAVGEQCTNPWKDLFAPELSNALDDGKDGHMETLGSILRKSLHNSKR